MRELVLVLIFCVQGEEGMYNPKVFSEVGLVRVLTEAINIAKSVRPRARALSGQSINGAVCLRCVLWHA
jgi:hypothetical protein